MERLLLAAHVVAGILFVGPVAVTTSLFPRYAPLAGRLGGAADGDGRSASVAAVLHRVTRLYGALALAVPLIGLVLAAVQGRLTEVWITLAMVLTAVAGGVLVLRITPIQREALRTPDDGARLRVLRGLAGVFNLLWTTVVVLMVVRPGAES
ncbi:hypothetical protein [Cellulomonas shaoxiangyii]|uniref:DUF2269 family protein n=1 Tax=Cellulomonas shaoxiangyii TaxID=2566013 RepID=A0A4P7SHT7_9CELL|nr:hypothetical protein [Cellulomonas shaoxiangyii]QCB92696.1 hypothetical protein E5225_03140 [Cellulomonas shaoxiangyii]TGY85821.1 hypothetical protein E5226_04585 [Cellulomonas shaoxiangyii]